MTGINIEEYGANECPVCEKTDKLYARHSFGAEIICTRCGVRSDFVPGNDYQTEEVRAIRRWNKDNIEYIKWCFDNNKDKKDIENFKEYVRISNNKAGQ